MRRSPITAAVLAAAALAAAGCGADDGLARSSGVRTVAIARVSFPARQHLAQRSTFAITVRNAGDATIPDLAVTLGGLEERAADGTQRPLWIAAQAPAGAVAAAGDTRAAGPLAPGERATLRWSLEAVAAGTHELSYEVAADVGGGARAQLASGATPRGTVAVRVLANPPFARVNPRTGAVVRVP